MSSYPYHLFESTLPAMGLIVLRVDETVETDIRRDVTPDLARLHVTRVPSGDELTPESIAGMERELVAAASLLPPACTFDVVGYACTSGAAQIGPDRVRTLVASGAKARQVTDPLSAALAAFEQLGVGRVGIVSPYVSSVAEPIRRAFVTHGVGVPDMLSFGEMIEARVARIDPRSIAEAARALAGRCELDAVFLSCTNLRTYDILPELADDLQMPVLSSNQVLSWHMAGLAGLSPDPIGLRR